VEQFSNLQRLETWCTQQATEGWDRAGAVRIETLGDPGWRVHVDLRGTELERRAYEEVRKLCPGETWLHCRVRNGCFEGCGGSEMLDTILASFLDWAQVAESVAV
jgi:immunity protein 53 of polymorphic toxin system